jgi:3-isopropylmalate/(R)-2-methylmalate dehydratase small subunit
MKTQFRGRAWLFADNVDTGTIISARFMSGTDNSDIGAYCLVDARQEFSKEAKPDDILVAGKNFGCGSSREHAPLAIKQRVRIVIAESFARIFYRNAINIGLYVVELPDASKLIADGSDIEINLQEGWVRNHKSGKSWRIPLLPDFMQRVYDCEGLYGYIKSRVEENGKAGTGENS